MGLLRQLSAPSGVLQFVASNGDDCQAHFPFLQWEILQSLETNRGKGLETGKLLLAEVS